MGSRQGREVPELEPRRAAAVVAEGGLLLDVREAGEWDAGHAPAARHVPLGELGSRLAELPGEGTIVVVCRSGARSALATVALREAGYDARNLAGGMKAWAGAGLELVSSSGTAGVVA